MGCGSTCANTAAAPSPGLPVVCLPGLARTAADFDELAPALAAGPPGRHVIAIDSRGRGHSEHDVDHTNYNCMTELGDIVSILFALGVGPAVFVGSSRGGVLTMLLGAAHPTAIAARRAARCRSGARSQGHGAHQGLSRQTAASAHLRGRRRSPAQPDERTVPKSDRGSMARLRATDLASQARCADTRLRYRHCPRARRHRRRTPDAGAVERIRRARAACRCWSFAAPIPICFRAATVEAMRARRDEMDIVEVPDQGHAPLLEGHLVRQIVHFVERCEAARGSAAAHLERVDRVLTSRLCS